MKEMRMEKSGHSSCFRQGGENNSEQPFSPALASAFRRTYYLEEGYRTQKEDVALDSLGHSSPAAGLISHHHKVVKILK